MSRVPIVFPADMPPIGSVWLVEADDQRFRPNVGLWVVNPQGQVLMGERSDKPGVWQAPQGGIDAGESTEQAAWRELWEETGLTPEQAELKAIMPQWLAYTYPTGKTNPEGQIGQKQQWACFVLSDTSLPNATQTPHQEFSQFRWVDPEQAVAQVVLFRQGIYKAVAAWVLAGFKA